MGHFRWSSSNIHAIYQRVNVPSSWEGATLTFSALVKATSDNTSGVLMYPYVDGCGHTASSSFGWVNAGVGWSLVTYTFILVSSGTLDVGVWLNDGLQHPDFYVDECSLSFGRTPLISPGRFASLQLGAIGQNRYLSWDNGAPTTGTWKAGDLILNNGSDNVIGWKCTVSGTPGIWKYIQGILQR
jgi:hypothetical protein